MVMKFTMLGYGVDVKLTDHYARIWDYGNEILRSNPRSTVEIGVDVELDGCFLRGKVKGEFLAVKLE